MKPLSQAIPRELQEVLMQGRTDPVMFSERLLGIPLHEGQKRWLRDTLRHGAKINVLVPSNRYGKAQSVDEPILTPTGWRKMGDIAVGDFVYSKDGTETKVTGVYPQGKKEVYKLTFDDGSWTEACGEHLWSVQLGRQRFTKNYDEGGKSYANTQYQQWQTRTTEELLQVDLTKAGNRPKIPVVDAIQFAPREVPMDPYLVGLLLGDGGLSGGSTILTTADQEIVDYVNQHYKLTPRGNYGYSLLKANDDVREIGLWGSRSHDKKVPEDYLYNTPTVRLAVLQGLMDTDGSISRRNKAIEISTCSEQLSEDIKFLVQSLGGKARISTRTPWYKKDGIRINGRLSYRVKIDIRINPFRLTRKSTVFAEKKLAYTADRILKKIELVGIKEAQCITVDHPSHLYVTRDFIVTHNSTVTAVKQIWKHFYKVGIPLGNQAAWVKAEYRTANVAPKSSLVEPVFKYIDQIMTSSFMIRRPDGTVVTNQCLIEWFYLKDRTISNTSTNQYKQFFAYNSHLEHRTIGATASDSLEGKPYGYISYDEAGRSYNLEAEVNGTFLARLFDFDGELDLVSTPDQTSPSILFHYKLYQDGLVGLNNTFTMEGELKDNTFFDPIQIAKQYKLYENNPLKDQVLHGKFVFGGDNIYDAQSILDATDDTLNDGVRYEEGHKYIIGVDTAMGSDEMVFSVLDVTDKPYRLVRQIAAKGNAKSPQMHMNDLIDLCQSYYDKDSWNLHMLIETWNGESARFYLDLPYWLQALTRCYGSWQPEVKKTDNDNPIKKKNNDAKKADVILALKKLLSAGELKIPNDPPLIQQLSIYREDDKNIPTDRLMALALACWLANDNAPLSAELSWLEW